MYNNKYKPKLENSLLQISTPFSSNANVVPLKFLQAATNSSSDRRKTVFNVVEV
jgi:hypothetical protein